MNGLYRCRCVVAYRPYASDRLIVFSERQVANVSVNLVWNSNNITKNMDGNTETGQFVNALTGSTANVTLSDPYMTGIAWAALFDSAAAYTSSAQAAWNSIMLPPCGEGENESSGKCRNYPEINDPLLRSGGFADFAHILIQFYYDVAGTKFGLDMYFRLQDFRIQHGSSYPQVTLQGVNPQTVVFNQNLVNYQLEENKTLEENLTKIVNDYGYEVSFCTDPDKKDTKQYLMPRSFKEKNVTAAEILNKYLSSVGGTMQSLPTKEYAKKISMCTRANLNQGCSVFYLGVGLYEGYNISGNVDPNNLNLNSEYNAERGLGYNYADVPLRDGENYTLYPLKAREREEKLRKADKVAVFGSEQFANYNNRYSNKLSTSGYIWRDSGPEVKTDRRTSTNMYGIINDGKTPKALLDGKVLIASGDFGRVLIATNYFFRYCNRAEPKVCWNSVIYQESVNLTSVQDNVEVGARVKIGDVIGTATAEKPEFVRFFVGGNGARGREITVTPGLVWKYAVPVEKLTDEEKKNIGLESTSEKPSGPVATGQTGAVIGRVGSTGRSRGPHLHAEWEDRRFIDANQVREFVKVSGTVTSTYNDPSRSSHNGVDIGGNNREPVELINGATLAEVVETKCTVESDINNGCGRGFGNYVIINTPKGKMILAHLAPGSVSPSGGTTLSTGSRYSTGVQTAPTSLGANVTTSFKGIPRALRIVPGRTILSFVTNYDEWVEQGRPANIDPGVWIAGRFSRWFVRDVNYQWNQGDLRVSVTGVTDWGNITSKLSTPTFDEYLKSFQDAGDFTDKTTDYYGYIRSAGDLCWKVGDKSSCEVICEEAQQFQDYLRIGQESGADPTIGGNFPDAQCTYEGTVTPNKAAANQVMGMLRSVGINSKNAYAGVLGNGMAESTLNFNVHNSGSPGSGCSSTPSSLLGTVGYGLFQWCGSRVKELAESGKCGRNCTLQQQLEFAANEIRTGRNISQQCVRRNWIKEINEASTPQRAADIWNECYERGPGGIEKRQNFARDIAPGLKCQRVNP